jgi:transketolase
VLAEADGGAPQAIIMATGSEVSVALAARDLLAKDGIRTRVVSMPCWETFAAQSAEYRESVLPAVVKARVSVEAGVTFGWQRWVGDAGVAIGIDHYGASAPGDTNMEKFGFTPDNVARTVRRLVA